MFIDFHQVRRKLSSFNIFNWLFKLHLNFLDFLWLLFFLCLEVEVVDILWVKWLNPLGDDESLLEELHFFILLIIHSFFTKV